MTIQFEVLMGVGMLCFFSAGVWRPATEPRVHVGWLGMFFCALAFLVK